TIVAWAEVYSPSTDAWTAVSPMAQARYQHSATLLNDGGVLVAGGSDADGPLTSAEVFDPNSGNWSSVGSLTQARRMHSATRLADGRVLVAGGVGIARGRSPPRISRSPAPSWRNTRPP